MRCRTILSLILAISFASCSETSPNLSRLSENHPFQSQLRCEQPPGATLIGRLYSIEDGIKSFISDYTSGFTGACELAIRASRNNRVCIDKNYSYSVIDITTRKTIKNFGNDFNSCISFTRGWEKLPTQKGYVQFIPQSEINQTLINLPNVSDPKVNGILQSEDTMWYDEASMVFSYQDSFGNPEGPEGLRANRVGYDVGSTSNIPDIRALTEYFKHGKFRFPFSIAAGVDFEDNTYVMNFWAPPKQGDETLPVIWWRSGSHWHWVFPIGTVIGEVLIMRAPEGGEWYVFEIRSRERQKSGWSTEIFRPFPTANDLAAAVRETRPGWESSAKLNRLVNHLEDATTMTPAKLESRPYRHAFKALSGFKDHLPEIDDLDLIKEFLTEQTFASAMGKVWKQHGEQKTYAAASNANFHIVPRNYIGGLLETTNKACTNCHDQTGRPLGQLDGRVVLYGEIWGEDQIFTWHPFEVYTEIFSVSDGSRRPNRRLIEAGLLLQRKPGNNESNYSVLEKPYDPSYSLQ